jgi:hypothetical protein
MADLERDARIFKRDGFICRYCGWVGDTFEKWRYLVVDHFEPRGCFQSSLAFDFRSYQADENLLTACVDCNLMKSDRKFATVEEAVAEIKKWVKGERQDYEKFFAPTKTAPNLSTVERLLDELDEWFGRVREIRQRLAPLPRGSEPYLDLLPDLEVELDMLRLKTEHAREALEEFEDSLPESE